MIETKIGEVRGPIHCSLFVCVAKETLLYKYLVALNNKIWLNNGFTQPENYPWQGAPAVANVNRRQSNSFVNIFYTLFVFG